MRSSSTLSLATLLLVTLTPALAIACGNVMIANYVPSTDVWLIAGPATLCLVLLLDKFVARWKGVATRYRIALIAAAMIIPNIIAMFTIANSRWIWFGINEKGFAGAIAFAIATGLVLAKTEEQIEHEEPRKANNGLAIVIAVSVILSLAVALEFAEPDEEESYSSSFRVPTAEELENSEINFK